MGRKVRRVAPGWEHPTHPIHPNRPLPLYDGSCFKKELGDWEKSLAVAKEAYEETGILETRTPRLLRLCKDHGFEVYWHECTAMKPDPTDYMPLWSEDEATHLMMFETTSEGTPISPAFETPEGLARWLADNDAYAIADRTATYEQWLTTIHSGSAVSLFGRSGGPLVSGVEAIGNGE